MTQPVPTFLTHGQDPTGAAHLEMVQHLLPRQEQQGLLPDLLGDLRVEEGVLSAAVRHPWGEEGKTRMGDLARDGRGLGGGRPQAPCGWASCSLLFHTSLAVLRGRAPHTRATALVQAALTGSLPPRRLRGKTRPKLLKRNTLEALPPTPEKWWPGIPSSPQARLQSRTSLWRLLQRPRINVRSGQTQRN